MLLKFEVSSLLHYQTNIPREGGCLQAFHSEDLYLKMSTEQRELPGNVVVQASVPWSQRTPFAARGRGGGFRAEHTEQVECYWTGCVQILGEQRFIHLHAVPNIQSHLTTVWSINAFGCYLLCS